MRIGPDGFNKQNFVPRAQPRKKLLRSLPHPIPAKMAMNYDGVVGLIGGAITTFGTFDFKIRALWSFGNWFGKSGALVTCEIAICQYQLRTDGRVRHSVNCFDAIAFMFSGAAPAR